jgi:membrane fusion protein, multidrug efflux system
MKMPSKKIVIPILLVLAGLVLAFVVVKAKPEQERTTPETPPPLVEVEVVTVRLESVPLDVESQGTVEPPTESTLVSQVSGRIVSVASEMAPGGFFRKGQPLFRLDANDYRLAVSQAESQLAQARLQLAREQAEAEVAREEWRELGTGRPSALALREPQLAQARAAVEAAEASVEQARLNLSRTVVNAPYDGRARSKAADVGQAVSPGTPLAEVFATEYAEVRLPVSQDQLAHLDLDLGASQEQTGPAVVLTGEIGGRPATWNARVVRTDGRIDPRTRMLGLFARVDDPFDREAGGNPVVLPMGMFVEAEIAGRQATRAAVIPRTALREEGDEIEVLVVDDGDKLRIRQVDVIARRGDRAIVGTGLADGDRLVVSPLDTPVDGMTVRVGGVGERTPPPVGERPEPRS